MQLLALIVEFEPNLSLAQSPSQAQVFDLQPSQPEPSPNLKKGFEPSQAFKAQHTKLELFKKKEEKEEEKLHTRGIESLGECG